jgi:hypothetical protein
LGLIKWDGRGCLAATFSGVLALTSLPSNGAFQAMSIVERLICLWWRSF